MGEVEFVKNLVNGGFTSRFVNSSTIFFLCVGGVSEVAVGAGSEVLAMLDVRVCRKTAITALPNAEKERVTKSKAPVDLKTVIEWFVGNGSTVLDS